MSILSIRDVLDMHEGWLIVPQSSHELSPADGKVQS